MSKSDKEAAREILEDIDDERADKMLKANKKEVGKWVSRIMFDVLDEHFSDLPETKKETVAEDFRKRFIGSILEER